MTGTLGAATSRPWRMGGTCLLELLWPEHCAACGRQAGDDRSVAGVRAAAGQDADVDKFWSATGPCVHGLRSWDRPHLCEACASRLFASPCDGLVAGIADAAPLAVVATAPTSALLTRVVGAWKYHGLRGLGWPLGRALARAASAAGNLTNGAVLVPVPLHATRRRARGFNQAAMLAEVAGPALGLSVATEVLLRRRATAQQARLSDTAERHRNLAGAFAVRASTVPGRALLVDDLVTAGATVLAAAAALRNGGWEVTGALAIGYAHSRGDDAAGAAADDPDRWDDL